ncbi:MAG TPA: imidazole glycerol phosphate synthase subunit HisH [Planctomycetota bacterium]|nr:imidazole glycerol phosphate synthase subunit HisH [Planctomycetota bacterium]
MDIAIIDYGVGNLRSAEKAFQHLGFDAALTRDPAELAKAKKIVLPGVGAFGHCMEQLRAQGFVEPLLKEVAARKHLLGICVGLQMLFEGSEESPGVAGLGLLKGTVRKFENSKFKIQNSKLEDGGALPLTPRASTPVGPLPGGEGNGGDSAARSHGALKIPQIGWNVLKFPTDSRRHPLFVGVAPNTYVYFVHSYYAVPENPRDVLAYSDYGGAFCASAGRANVSGVQFHPEKSQRAGLGILGNFGRL